jgi:hypothetical protein
MESAIKITAVFHASHIIIKQQAAGERKLTADCPNIRRAETDSQLFLCRSVCAAVAQNCSTVLMGSR